METVKNPFVLGHKIERPYFCDREEEERALVSAVTNGRNVVMISPRRMGKTTLIHIAMNDSEEIRQEYLTVFLDILQTGTLSEFTYLLGKAVFNSLRLTGETRLRGFLAALKSLKGTFGFDPMSGTPTFNVQLGDIHNPEYTLEEIFSYVEQSDRPVVIAIDEFQQITKYPEKNVEAILRSHIQRMSNATFIFAGSERHILQEMFISSKRPFYNSAELMHLGPIPEGIYAEFAHHLFSERRRGIDRESIRKVFRLFDGNTFYMQRTMNGAFASTPEGGVCDDEAIIKTIHVMLASNEVMYREILSNVNASSRQTLYALAADRIVNSPMSGTFLKRHGLPSASVVQNALKTLTRTGFVSRSEQGYYLTDPLLRIFINSLYSTPEI